MGQDAAVGNEASPHLCIQHLAAALTDLASLKMHFSGILPVGLWMYPEAAQAESLFAFLANPHAHPVEH